MKRLLLLSTLLILCTSSIFAQNGKYVGGDISLLPAYEQSKTVYLDANGKKIDNLLLWLKNDCGWNTFRVRLFVNPTNANHDGVIQDIEYVKALGKRIKDAGALFMLDFHYSDTWADPSQQKLPAAWSDCTTSEKKADKVYAYTKESLEVLKAADACPDLVQVGNEISYGMVGIKVNPWDNTGDWDGLAQVLGSGCKAVREVCPQARIIIHTERSGSSKEAGNFYSRISDVDYDIIGLSYYPFWHGTLDKLSATLTKLKADFPTKEVQIVETAYYFRYWPTQGVTTDTRSKWECSAEGQYNFMKDLIAELAKHDNVNGLSYWCPEEAGCGDNANWTTYRGVVIKDWINRGLWWPTNSNGHWPLTASGNMVQMLMKSFLSEEAASIEVPMAEQHNNTFYNTAGQKVSNSHKGIVIKDGRKYYRR